MSQVNKVEILVASIRSRLILPEGQEENLRSALEEGLSKVDEVERVQTKAVSPYRYIEVQMEDRQGFALWAAGGFDVRSKRGYAITAAGPDGRPLKPYQGDEWAAPALATVSGMLYCRVKSAAEGRSADKLVSGDRFYRAGWEAVCEMPVPVQFRRRLFYIQNERGRSGSLFRLDGVCSLYGKQGKQYIDGILVVVWNIL